MHSAHWLSFRLSAGICFGVEDASDIFLMEKASPRRGINLRMSVHVTRWMRKEYNLESMRKTNVARGHELLVIADVKGRNCS